MSLGSKIKELRNNIGLTQKELAEQLNVTAQAVSRWESDEVEPSVGTIKQMANIFNVSTDELLGNATEPVVVEKVVEVEKPIIVEKPTVIEKEVVVEKPVIVEKEVVVEKPVQQKTVLAICSHCNKPIYDEDDLVKHRTSGGRGHSAHDYYLHKACDAERIQRSIEANKKDNEKRFVLSFVLGGLAAAVMLIIFIVIATKSESPAQYYVTGSILAVLLFTMISCFVIGNNFLLDLWISIASWSVHFPGIIFTLDMDGIKALIAMKLLFAILGVLVSIAVFLLACAIAMPLSLFVYPYAIIHNVKHREEQVI